MTRKAECCCGDAFIRVSGDPYFHALCHCNNCQRRTGSDAANVATCADRLYVPVQSPGAIQGIDNKTRWDVLEPGNLRHGGAANIAVDGDEGWFFKHGVQSSALIC